MRVVATVAVLLSQARPAAASTLPFDSACIQDYCNANRAMALDAAGVVYVVAICAGQVQLTVSTNDGATWLPPIEIGGPATSVTVAGGTVSGAAIVAWSDRTSVSERHVTNFGGTLSPVSLLRTVACVPEEGLDALAVGSEYLVMVAVPSFASGAGALVWRSLDRAGAWEPEVFVPSPWVFGDLLRDATTGNIELVSDDPSVYRSTSTDAGASFSPYRPLDGTCCVYYSDWAMGCGLLYTTGMTTTATTDPSLAWRYDLAAGATVEQLTTPPTVVPQQHSAAVDAGGDLFAVAKTVDGIQLVRWRAGFAATDAPILVAPAGDRPHVATCGGGTAYVVYQDPSGAFQFTSLCLDGPCCGVVACGAQPQRALLRNGDLTRLAPLSQPLSALLAPGDGSGLPGRTALDRVAPAQRFPGFLPGPLAGEMSRGGPLVFYELEEPDGLARVLELSKAGPDLVVWY